MLKDKNISALVKRLQDEGIIKATTYVGALSVVHYWIRTGKVTPRRRPHSGYFQFNDQEIDQIVKAFDYGGEGVWDYREQS